MSSPSAVVPRLRLFAGPNGSGKSTLIRAILRPELIGVYVNADDLEAGVRRDGFLEFATYGLSPLDGDPVAYLRDSAFLASQGVVIDPTHVRREGSRLHFDGLIFNAYLASVLADFIRRELLVRGVSFTFESVMSSPDKIEFLQQAHDHGYRIYLYYIATEDPEINLSRVRSRVRLGEHDVPPDKVVQRYHRSLSLLLPAIAASDRAYIFDNSGSRQDHVWLAEITDGELLELKTDLLPAWFKRSVLGET